jgi:hypothetical protein
MSTFDLIAANTQATPSPLYAEFRGLSAKEWEQRFAPDLPNAMQALDTLLTVVRWWSAAGLAVFSSRDEALRALQWIGHRLRNARPSLPPLPFRVEHQSQPGTQRVLCSWHIPSASIDRQWADHPHPQVLTRSQSQSPVWAELKTLHTIARDLPGMLVIVDAYYAESPGLTVLENLAGLQTDQRAPEILLVGAKNATDVVTRLARPRIRELTKPSNDFHDRFACVFGHRPESTKRTLDLVTAVFLGQGLATGAGNRARISAYGRVSGQPLTALGAALACRYDLSIPQSPPAPSSTVPRPR